jgi:hypothetical protein
MAHAIHMMLADNVARFPHDAFIGGYLLWLALCQWCFRTFWPALTS